MNSLLRSLVLWALLLGGIASAGAARIIVVPIKGEISEAKFYFLRRALKEAEEEGAKAVVLNMDTHGGDLDAAVAMQEALARTTARTLTYVNPNSASAGALIALSTREIYMAPISAIGAAAPVTAAGENLPGTMEGKVISYYTAYFRSAAQRNGHNPDIAEAFIDKKKTVKVGDKVIHEAGAVLTLSAQKAVELVNGKPLLAAGVAESLEEMLKQAKLKGELVTVEPTGFESVAFWITTLAPLFLLGGILGAWIEFKLPGVWIPGMISVICFTIFFLGHYLAGLAGWEAPLIFILGLILVIRELTIHPGTILPGLIGAALMAGSIIYAMVDRYPNQALFPSTKALIWPMVNLGMAATLAGLGIAALARYLPGTSLYHHLILATSGAPGTSLSPEHSEFTRVKVGDEGQAVSILRPSGRAILCGESYDVITRGSFVEAGTPVRVVAVEGARIVVEAV